MAFSSSDVLTIDPSRYQGTNLHCGAGKVTTYALAFVLALRSLSAFAAPQVGL